MQVIRLRKPVLGRRLVRLSHHAIDRALDMAVTGDEIRNAIVFPDYIKVQQNYPGTELMVGGRVAVPLRKCADDDETLIAVTVLWSTRDEWITDAERARGREAPGRYTPYYR